MNLETIKAAVLNGQTVCWSTTDYVVKYHERGGFNIVYTPDGNCIGLTHQDDVTLNGKESEFFIPVEAYDYSDPDLTTLHDSLQHQ